MWKWEWICWFVNLISRRPADRTRRFRRLVERLSREADLDGGWWSVYREYPKQPAPSTAPMRRPATEHGAEQQTAIVVQGPFIEHDEQTLETLRLYRRTMPDAPLIYSTWNDLPDHARRRIESAGVHLVTGEKPEHSGPHNLNLQIVSTRRGLEEAQRLGFSFAMKTRSDTRIHMSEVDRFCMDLLSQFPLGTPCNQRERIIVVDFATRLYIPYHASDIMMFGTTDDLLSYWSLDLCSPDVIEDSCDDPENVLRETTPEVILGRQFFQRMGVNLENDLEQWWRILADRFIVIDRDMVHLFWPKYNYNADQRIGMRVDTSKMALCHFSQWLQLYVRGVAPSITLDQLRGRDTHASLLGMFNRDAA